jgi:hypothetical protein
MPNANEEYCRGCGRVISSFAVSCPACGAPTGVPLGDVSDKSRLAALLLCFFIGMFGVHRFYVGKVGTGLLSLFTLGGLGIWAFIDFILIACGVFRDKQGRKVVLWD